MTTEYFASAKTILDQPSHFHNMAYRDGKLDEYLKQTRFTERMNEYPGNGFLDKVRWATKTKLVKMARAMHGLPITSAVEALATSLPITFLYPDDMPDESTEWGIKWAMWDGIMDAAKMQVPLDPSIFFWHAPWIDNMGYETQDGQKVLLENTFTHELRHAREMHTNTSQPAYITFNFQADRSSRKITVITAHAGGRHLDQVRCSLAPDFPSSGDISDAFNIDPERTRDMLMDKPFFKLLRPEYQSFFMAQPGRSPARLIEIVQGVEMDAYNETADYIDQNKIASKDNFFPVNIKNQFVEGY